MDAGAKNSAAELTKRYFKQLVEGCGRKGCPNRNCFSCADGPGHLDRTTAALRALELAQGNAHELCEDQPPFLHLQLVREMVADAARTGEWRPLEKEVSGVFSNSDALNRSFLQADKDRQASATDLQARAIRAVPPCWHARCVPFRAGPLAHRMLVASGTSWRPAAAHRHHARRVRQPQRPRWPRRRQLHRSHPTARAHAGKRKGRHGR